MQDADTRIEMSKKRHKAPHLELVVRPSKRASFQASPTHMTETQGGIAATILRAYGPVGRAFHACEPTEDPNKTALTMTPADRMNGGDKTSPVASWTLQISAWYVRWRRERLIREQITYFRHLPDWVLRDIGLQRDQVVHAVRTQWAQTAPSDN